MCSEKDGTNVPTPSSSPTVAAPGGNPPGEPPQPPNAFEGSFLARLADRDEPAAAEEAEWSGPWRLEPLPEGGFGLFRAPESAARGDRPFARFPEEADARLTLAMLLSRREALYRLRPLAAGEGYAVQSRAAWGETVAWLDVFDDDLVARLSWAESLMRSPQALALFLESCGKVVLERAGAILEERVRPTDR
jgi:hypothetical protein